MPADLGDPWKWMQPADVARFGPSIVDPDEQVRWTRAIFLGGLPYMWRKAEVVREAVYQRMELRPGDNVLLLGEAVEACGFVDDVRRRIGPTGEIRVVEIMDEARDAYIAGRRGSGGQLATWRYGYTTHMPDMEFDCVAVLQGVQHAEDWRETGRELLRVMKPGRNIILAEITFGPEFRMKTALDMHIEYLFEKVFARIGWRLEDFPYYSPQELSEAFAPMVSEPGIFTWKGVELFWGRKPLL